MHIILKKAERQRESLGQFAIREGMLPFGVLKVLFLLVLSSWLFPWAIRFLIRTLIQVEEMYVSMDTRLVLHEVHINFFTNVQYLSAIVFEY